MCVLRYEMHSFGLKFYLFLILWHAQTFPEFENFTYVRCQHFRRKPYKEDAEYCIQLLLSVDWWLLNGSLNSNRIRLFLRLIFLRRSSFFLWWRPEYPFTTVHAKAQNVLASRLLSDIYYYRYFLFGR